MEETFFDLPLDRELYVPKKFLKKEKRPLRILVTDAGCKIAFNIIYELCSGKVFGKDQGIIIHLINSRGSMHHKAIILELETCGFAASKDFVLSSNPEIAYKNVDIVIAIATYEEIPGRSIANALIYQLIKARHLAIHIQDYASKNVKVIFTGPSTKAVTTLLGAFKKFAPNIPSHNVTCVTMLDVTISKGMLAAKLKTTTDKIKNVIIWANTFPDICNATVSMYPPNDIGKWEMKEIPIREAIQDDIWLFSTFPMAIYQRTMKSELIKFGKAVAQAVIDHIQCLLDDSYSYSKKEYISMGVIAPTEKKYGVPPECGFSFPVAIKNGRWEIIENIKYDTATHLNILRSIYNLSHSVLSNSIMKVVAYMINYETSQKQTLNIHDKNFIKEIIETNYWITRYFVTPIPAENIPKVIKDRRRESKKSIAWDDDLSIHKKKVPTYKSSIRFSLEKIAFDKKSLKIQNEPRDSFFEYLSEDLEKILSNISDKPFQYLSKKK